MNKNDDTITVTGMALPHDTKDMKELLAFNSFLMQNPKLYHIDRDEAMKIFRDERDKIQKAESGHVIYKDIKDWYNPEIDYGELLEKIRWTQNTMTRYSHHDPIEFPLDHVMLLDHADRWDVPGEKIGKQQMFQFWNRQFNDELAKVFKKWKPKLILDVCAGDGRLAQLMARRGLNVKAVDNYSWEFEKRYFDVEKMDYRDALALYKPDVVVGCWMNLNTDYTPDFRKTDSVKHYMMIGEGDGGCTGGNWEERPGWNLEWWNKASHFSISRSDMLTFSYKGALDMFGMMHHSSVCSFSRIDDKNTETIGDSSRR
jgi:hypothetical protein